MAASIACWMVGASAGTRSVAAPAPTGGEGHALPEPSWSQDAGYEAHGEGLTLSDNPHPTDTRAHLDWQNGWSQAHDEALRRHG